jgi:hypothetical protein
MIQIHQLPASTTIADADMIPFDTGSANKYITAGNLLSQQKLIALPTTQDITVSVDALAVGRAYAFSLSSYGSQETCGVPENAGYVGTIYCNTATSYKTLEIRNVSNGNTWVKVKSNGTWGDWKPAGGAMLGLSITQDITVSADALSTGRSYAFAINSYQYQAATGMPTNSHYRGIITKNSPNNIQIVCWGDDASNPMIWIKNKNVTWGKWRLVAGRLNYTPTAGSLMASGGAAWRVGGMMTWEIGVQVNTSGTLAADGYIGRIEGLKIPGSIHFPVAIGTTPEWRTFRVVNNNNGIELRNNNTTTTLTANQYIIGSVTFPVEEV